MRLDYVPDPLPDSASEEDRAIADRIRQRRHPRGLTELDRTLLYSPPVADGWNTFMGAIRTRTDTLTPAVRELAICRIATLNRAPFEYHHHFPLLAAALPAHPEPALHALLHTPAFHSPSAQDLPDEKLRAVLAYTDAMTRNVAVEDDVWAALRRCCGEREAVEVTAVVAAYNCVSRFLVALEVGKEKLGEETGEGVVGEEGT